MVTPSIRLGFVQGHPWTFFRAGGLDQVQLSTKEDLKNLRSLDQKLWVALSCPVKGLEFDPKTLAMIDTDKDGRVRVAEIIAAVEWVMPRLKDAAVIFHPGPSLPLSAIDASTPEGKTVLEAARQVLENLGKPGASELLVGETSDTVRIFTETAFNGDGVVQAGCAKDPATRQAIEDIIACLGTDTDRSGLPGIGQAKLDQFLAECAAFDAWWKTGEVAEPGTPVLPMGDGTPAAFTALQAVRAKIGDYFTRCRLAAYDPRATARLNRQEADYDALATRDLSAPDPGVEGLPLSQVAAGKALPLDETLNPAWSLKMADFRRLVVEPILGPVEAISEAQWAVLVGHFAAYEGWIGGKAGAVVEKLGIQRVREILASDAKVQIDALIAKDLSVAPHVAAIEDVDRLTRYYRDLGRLLVNFVNFSDFYDRQPPAPIFIAGTLYFDQRACELCIRVDSEAAHAALANMGKVYIAYCKCTRPGGESMIVACGVTQGDSDYLMVGRNGIFYDRLGRDWDATVVKILDHPVSIRQAFWSPYKKIGKMVSDLIEKFAGDADKSIMDKTNAQVGATAAAAQAGKPAEKPKIDTGMLAAIGIAATSLISGLSALAAAVFGLPLWKIPLVFVGIMFAISTPSMIIAFLKLRQRTLGPLLEANGWAINGRVKINLPLGNSLTYLKRLPPGSLLQLTDPFEDKSSQTRSRWIKAIIALLILIGVALFLFPAERDSLYYKVTGQSPPVAPGSATAATTAGSVTSAVETAK